MRINFVFALMCATIAGLAGPGSAAHAPQPRGWRLSALCSVPARSGASANPYLSLVAASDPRVVRGASADAPELRGFARCHALALSLGRASASRSTDPFSVTRSEREKCASSAWAALEAAGADPRAAECVRAARSGGRRWARAIRRYSSLSRASMLGVAGRAGAGADSDDGSDDESWIARLDAEDKEATAHAIAADDGRATTRAGDLLASVAAGHGAGKRKAPVCANIGASLAMWQRAVATARRVARCLAEIRRKRKWVPPPDGSKLPEIRIPGVPHVPMPPRVRRLKRNHAPGRRDRRRALEDAAHRGASQEFRRFVNFWTANYAAGPQQMSPMAWAKIRGWRRPRGDPLLAAPPSDKYDPDPGHQDPIPHRGASFHKTDQVEGLPGSVDGQKVIDRARADGYID